MAIYHLDAKIISRSDNRSVIAAAAYRSGGVMSEERTGRVHDYSRKRGVEHAEVMAPEDAPVWMLDRARLWNGVDAVEKRKDAQLAREIEVSLPRELSERARLELVRSYARAQFVDHGMIADIAIHNPPASDGAEQPHAHILLTMRDIEGEGFGKKARDWNSKERLEGWRETWAAEANRALEREGVAERIDHRSLAEQRTEAERCAREAREANEPEQAQALEERAVALDREPQPKLGPVVSAMERRGAETRRGDELRAVEARNAERRSLWDDVRGWTREITDQAKERIESAADRLRAGLAKADLSGLLANRLRFALASNPLKSATQLGAEADEVRRQAREREETARAKEAEQQRQKIEVERAKAEQIRRVQAEAERQKDRDRDFER